jgi:hypothetical protein
VSFSTTGVKEKQEGTDFSKFETFIKTNVAPNDVFVYSDWRLCDIPGVIACVRNWESHIHCLPVDHHATLGNSEFKSRLFNQRIAENYDFPDNMKDIDNEIWLIAPADNNFSSRDQKGTENNSRFFKWNRYYFKITQLKNISHE